MKLSICTDVLEKFHLQEMLDKVKAYGIDAIERDNRWMGRMFFCTISRRIDQ